ncbi:MAG: TonB-dependent receptor [Bacteroidales bacterium]|nr:TonB-dependent receptor [Bacteroidales bacterium]
MKKIFIVIILWFIAFNALSQTSKTTDANINGHIIDKETNQHIPFVNIHLKGTTLGAVSDETGHYFMTNLPEGSFVLVASSINYEPEEIEIVIVKNKTQEINFMLQPQVTLMETVVVSANKYETKQREAASVVNVVSPKLFEQTSSKNVAEVLPFQTGLRVEETCSNCGVPQLRINGLDGAYSQILMDSRAIFSSLASVYGLEQFPAGMIDRVEIIRGGGSALFGSNAIGGIVNIITKEPDRNALSLSHTATLMDNQSWDNNTVLNGQFVTSDFKTGAYLFGTVRNRDAYDRNKDGFSDIPQLKSTAVGFRAYHKTSDYSKLTLEYHHIHEYRRGGDSINLPPHEANLAEQLEHNIDGGSLKFDIFTKNGKHFWSVYSSLQNIARKSYFGTHKDLNAYGNTSDIMSVSGLQYQYNMKRCWFLPATLIAGGEYSYDQLHDVMVGYHRDILQTVHIFGLFLQNEWKNEKVSFLLGARLDKHSLMNDPVFSPRLTLRYSPTKAWTLRASYASGYRAPQVYDEDLHVGAVGGEVSLITLDPNLKPENSNSVNLSADWYQQWGKTQVNVLAEGFYTLLQHSFLLMENGHDSQGNLLLIRQNATDKLYVAGINVEGRFSYRQKLSAQIGYTFQQSRYNTPQTWSEDPTAETHTRLLRTPDSYGYLTFNYECFKNFNASITGTYTGSMMIPHYAGYIDNDVLTTTESFFDVNAQLIYGFSISQRTKLEVKVGIKNIFNSFQNDIDQGVDRDAGYIYGPALPRSLYFGAQLKI